MNLRVPFLHLGFKLGIMNIHYFQHVPYEGLGRITEWAGRPGNTLTATRFYEDHRLPYIDLFDMLIVMGGPMGANDEHRYSWMTAEKKMIEQAIRKEKKVLGICLGAQLIADVLGGKVYPNKDKEIGWFPIQITQEGKEGYFRGSPDNFDVFHWHGDTFDLPTGAKLLATSKACKNQAFSYGSHVLGLQFHLEVSKEDVDEFLVKGSEELVDGPYIQKKKEIIQTGNQKYDSANDLLSNILERITRQKEFAV